MKIWSQAWNWNMPLIWKMKRRIRQGKMPESFVTGEAGTAKPLVAGNDEKPETPVVRIMGIRRRYE